MLEEHLDCFVFHQFLKLNKVDLAVTIQVGFLNHGDHFLLTEGLPQVVHRDHQLLLGDQPVTVPVKDPEAVCDVLLDVAALPRHHGDELIEVNPPVLLVLLAVRDHCLQFLFRWTEPMFSQNLQRYNFSHICQFVYLLVGMTTKYEDIFKISC